MFDLLNTKARLFKAICLSVAACFFLTGAMPSQAFAQHLGAPPAPSMVPLSPAFTPTLVRGIRVYPDNPFTFDFIVDSGDTGLTGDALTKESEKLIRYFLASLTIPENNLWVNLSPHEKDRIIPDTLGATEMGHDMLAQDYLLKQITASLTNPDSDLGKEFWSKIYKKAYEEFGTTNIPVDTFNKVWIMPDKAEVYENGDKAFVADSKLKVMLEEDYVALQAKQQVDSREHIVSSEKPLLNTNDQMLTTRNTSTSTATLSSQIVREVFIPVLEKEVNEGKNFAILRQIYNTTILSYWYKTKLKDSILNQAYANQQKVKGIDFSGKAQTQAIYDQYLDTFKKGVCNMMKVEYDPYVKKAIPRKYFAGGVQWIWSPSSLKLISGSAYQEHLQGPGRPKKVYDIQFSLKDVDAATSSTHMFSPWVSDHTGLGASSALSSVSAISNVLGLITGDIKDVADERREASINLDNYFTNQKKADEYIDGLIEEYGSVDEKSFIYAEIREILDKILIAAGLDIRKFHLTISGDRSANAAIIAHSSHVIVNVGLLTHAADKKFSKDAIAGILAHEVGHILRHLAYPVDFKDEQGSKKKGHDKGIQIVSGIIDRYSNETASDLAILSLMEKAGFNVNESTRFFKELLKIKWMSSRTASLLGVHYPTLARRVARLEDALVEQYWETENLAIQPLSNNFIKEARKFKKELAKEKKIVVTEESRIQRIESLNPEHENFEVDLLSEALSAAYINFSLSNSDFAKKITEEFPHVKQNKAASEKMRNSIVAKMAYVRNPLVSQIILMCLMDTSSLKTGIYIPRFSDVDQMRSWSANFSYEDIRQFLKLDFSGINSRDSHQMFNLIELLTRIKVDEIVINGDINIDRLKDFISSYQAIERLSQQQVFRSHNIFDSDGHIQHRLLHEISESQMLNNEIVELFIDFADKNGRYKFGSFLNEHLAHMKIKNQNIGSLIKEVVKKKYLDPGKHSRVVRDLINFDPDLVFNTDYNDLHGAKKDLHLIKAYFSNFHREGIKYLRKYIDNKSILQARLLDVFEEVFSQDRSSANLNFEDFKDFVLAVQGGKEWILNRVSAIKIKGSGINVQNISWETACFIYYFWFLDHSASVYDFATNGSYACSETEQEILKQVIWSRAIVRQTPGREYRDKFVYGYDLREPEGSYTKNLFWAIAGEKGVSAARGFEHHVLDLFGIMSWYRDYYISQDSKTRERILATDKEAGRYTGLRYFDFLSGFNGSLEEMADLMKMYNVPKHVINLFVYSCFYDRYLKDILPSKIDKFRLGEVRFALLKSMADPSSKGPVAQALKSWQSIVQHLDHEVLLEDLKNGDILRREGKVFTEDQLKKNEFMNKVARYLYRMLYGEWAQYVPSPIKKFVISLGNRWVNRRKEALIKKYGVIIRYTMPELLSNDFGFKEMLLLMIEASQKNKSRAEEMKKNEEASEISPQELKNPFFDDLYGNFLHIEIAVSDFFEPMVDAVISDTGKTFEEKVSYITSLFPEASRVRDVYLLRLLNVGDQRLDKINAVRNLFANSHYQEMYSLRALEQERALFPEKFVDPLDHLRLITENYFPEPSYLRDDLLNDLVRDQNITDSHVYAAIRPFMLSFLSNADQEKHRKYIFLEDKLFELIRDMNPRDKKNILLWLIDIVKIKPEPIKMIEQRYHINIDHLKNASREINSSYYPSTGNVGRKKMLEMFLDGPGGIVSDGIVYQEILEMVFSQFIAQDAKYSRVLKAIFSTVLRFSSSKKKKAVFLSLVHRYQKILADPQGGHVDHQAAFIKQFLEIYGVIGVKLGQLLADMPELDLPAEIKEALSSLRDQASPSDIGMILDYAKKLFGEKEVRIIKRLGDASIKSVFLVEIDGLQWVLKIKKPEAEKMWEEDLEVLKKTVSSLKFQRIGDVPKGIVEAVRAMILKELDFKGEKLNQEELSANMKKRGSDIFCPVAEIAINNTAILEPYVRGISAQQFLQTHKDAQKVKDELRRELLSQIFVDGFFHMDLHAGNVIIDDKGRINIIDLGGVSRISVKNQERVLKFLIHAQEIIHRYSTKPVVKSILARSRAAQKEGAMGQVNQVFGLLQALRRIKVISRSTYDEMHSVIKALISAHYLFEGMTEEKFIDELKSLSTFRASMRGQSSSSIFSSRVKLSDVAAKGVADAVSQNTGGIDFNAKGFNLRITGQGADLIRSESVEVQRFKELEGLTPIIIQVTPIVNFYQLLGMSTHHEGPTLN